jgi:dihydrofolate reductase
LYVNGILASSLLRTGSISTSTNALQIGGDAIYGQYFQGSIDEVRIYNRALTAAQIQADMGSAIGSAGLASASR